MRVQIRQCALLSSVWVSKYLTMEKRSNLLPLLILFSGLGLIVAGFFLLVSEVDRNEIFWLNIVVVSVVFLANYINVFGLLGVHLNFNSQVAALGIRLIFIRFYSIIAILVMLICWKYEVDFRYQLYLQLIGGFFLLLTVFLTQLSTEKASTVAIEQEDDRAGKTEMLRLIQQFELMFSSNTDAWLPEKKAIDLFKERVRYLSPTNDNSARDVDKEIVVSLRKALACLGGTDSERAEFPSYLKTCESLLTLRKSTYSN